MTVITGEESDETTIPKTNGDSSINTENKDKDKETNKQ